MRTPRDDYPRPHLARDDRPGEGWLSLCGVWRFGFGNDGDAGECPDAATFDRDIVVPFPWESFAAWGKDSDPRRDWNEDYLCAAGYPDTEDACLARYREAPRHTVGWYRRRVRVPGAFVGRSVFLCFGAVDYRATVWVNGSEVARHEGGYLPFEADVTDLVEAGAEAEITVRAEDAQDHLDQPAGKQIGWYERTSGIWQPVWIETRGECWVRDVRIAPDVAGEAISATVSVGGASDEPLRVILEVVDAEGGAVGSVEAHAVDGCASARVPVPSPRLWDVDDPYRYRLRVQLLRDEEILDVTESPFGMRTVSAGRLGRTGPPCVELNGRPIYLRGVLAQNFNPFGVYTYPTVAMMRRDIEAMKQSGFNMIRIHIKIEDPLFLDLADEIGMLIMYDLPCFGRYTDVGRQRYEQTLRGAIERDSNHPSIFAWVLFNETWGLGNDDYKQQPDRWEWVRSMVRLAHELDPTRLVEDNSPCLYDHVQTDINSWHFYINDQAKAEEHIAHVVRETRPGSGFNWVPGGAQGDQPLMNSEYGGIGAGAGDMDVSWCFHFLTNALRKHESVCGYVYTEASDIEWERNGFLKYDRRSKDFGYDPTFINADDVLALDTALGGTCAPGSAVAIPAVASLFSQERLAAAKLGWQVDLTDTLGRTVQAVSEGECDVSAAAMGVTRLGEIAVSLPEQSGLARIAAWLESDAGIVLARNWVYRDLEGEGCDTAGREVIRLGRGEWVGFGETETEPGLWRGAVGAGEVRFSMRAPKAPPQQLTILAELSAWRPGFGQTWAVTHPTDVDVHLGPERIGGLTLPDSPCDARGVLSGIAGRPCKYGYRVELNVKGAKLANALARAGETPVRFRVRESAENVGGLGLFLRNGGRYPLGPTVVCE